MEDAAKRDANDSDETLELQNGELSPPAVEDDSEGPAAGTLVGDYELISELGRGGMGVVYKARQRSLDRPVALKLIHPSLTTNDEYVERFRAEARAAAKIRHPGSVSVHEVGQHHGQHYIAMEYVEGRDLAEVSGEGPMEIEAAVLCVQKVARAVADLHKNGILHRDLKPSNIIVDDRGEPHVTDFGLAKFFDVGAGGSEGAIVGTPSYMSPEQASGEDDALGPQSDVYSLGAILYSLLCARPPFTAQSPLDTLVQVVEKEPELPSRLRAEIPGSLELICLKCLDKSPGRRYASAAGLADDLQRFLEGEVVEAEPQGLSQRLRRWVRREPALSLKLIALSIFFVTEMLWYHVFEFVDADFHVPVIWLLGVWAAVSVLFQRLLTQRRFAELARHGWAAADALLLTGIIWSGPHSMQSPLVAAYFLLIAVSGLWFRVRLVAFVTVLSVLCYALLAWRSAGWAEEERRGIDEHLIFLICFAVLGCIVAYQVYRLRILSRLYRRQAR